MSSADACSGGAAAAGETKEQFSAKLRDVLSKSAVGLGIAMGVENGLLEKMASMDKPRTSQQLADESGFKERYVREWLGLIATGGIVDYDPTSETYFLPHHRRAVFTSGCVEQEIAMFIRCLPMMGSVFDDVRRCFDLDGPSGIPYSRYNHHPQMSQPRFQHRLIDELGAFPGLTEQLESGMHVLDIACGSGLSTTLMARRFPKSHFTGVDIEADVVVKARESASNEKLSNIEYVCADATDMPADWSGKFDFLFVYNGIHDIPRGDKMIAETYRVLAPGAKAMFHEPNIRSKLEDQFQNPAASVFYCFSLYRCLPLALDAEDSLGLGTAWGKERCQKMLEDAGFNVLSVEPSICHHTNRFQCIKPKE